MNQESLADQIELARIRLISLNHEQEISENNLNEAQQNPYNVFVFFIFA